MTITAALLPSGDLQLTADNETRAWIKEQQAREVDSLSILSAGTEHYWTNGRYEPFDAGQANPFVGLTDAPCVAECLDVHDDGEREIVGRLWYFPAYMLRDPTEDLKRRGNVIFALAARVTP